MKSEQFVKTVSKEEAKLDVVVEIGSLEIRPSASQEIIIDATYQHMDVFVEQKENTVFVRAEQEEGFDHKLKRLFRDEQPKAELVIQVPPTCEINAKTITGKQEVTGIQASVTSRVVTGNHRLSDIQGPLYAKTMTGKLYYTGKLTEDNHRFETVTGSIHLTVPPTTSAELSASTTTGKLVCSLPLTNVHHERRVVGSKLRGTLGDGNGRIKVKITTGKLFLEPIGEKEASPAEKLETLVL